MITKEAMEKVAAADAVDQANAIDRGFEQACFDMGLDPEHARGLAKIAMERLAEFKKIAGEFLPPHPAATMTPVTVPPPPRVPGNPAPAGSKIPPLQQFGGGPVSAENARIAAQPHLGNGTGIGNFATKAAPPAVPAKPAPELPKAPPTAPMPPVTPTAVASKTF